VIVPGAVHVSGFIEGSASVFDTPRFCRFDFLAQIFQHNEAMLSQFSTGPNGRNPLNLLMIVKLPSALEYR